MISCVMRLSSYYRVEIEPAEEGGFIAHIPALGCATQGETYQQTVEMAEECIRSALLGYLERGESFPTESNPTYPSIAIRVELPTSTES